MTTYFDTLQGWLNDLERAEDDSAPLRKRCFKHASQEWWQEDPHTLEARGWAAYLLATVNHPDDEEDEPSPIEDFACLTVVQAIEAKVRRDLRYLDAALYAMTGRPCMEFCALWRNHPPYEDDIPEDLAPMTQRVARLCSAAHDLMHYIATTYGVSDNPATAAEQAMDRADGKDREGGKP